MSSQEQQIEKKVVEEESKAEEPKEKKKCCGKHRHCHRRFERFGPFWMRRMWDEEYSSSSSSSSSSESSQSSSTESSSDETIQISKKEYEKFVAWKQLMEARRNFFVTMRKNGGCKGMRHCHRFRSLCMMGPPPCGPRPPCGPPRPCGPCNDKCDVPPPPQPPCGPHRHHHHHHCGRGPSPPRFGPPCGTFGGCPGDWRRDMPPPPCGPWERRPEMPPPPHSGWW